mmetsp:Transcript_140162/g.340607  ORF Transcript_140162/g.340607 Transcript_140162/m.340607 type:complete len:231 (+) Transcript_140162:64-756(+)
MSKMACHIRCKSAPPRAGASSAHRWSWHPVADVSDSDRDHEFSGSDFLGCDDLASSEDYANCANSDDISSEADEQQRQSTSWMLANIPEVYSRTALVELLQREGFVDSVDYLFLPVFMTTGMSMGHAFLNFVTPEDGTRFCKHFQGFQRWTIPGAAPQGQDSAALVTDCGVVQGLEAHIQLQRNSCMMHESVPDEHKPILLQNGVRVPFPPPTKPIIRLSGGQQLVRALQ